MLNETSTSSSAYANIKVFNPFRYRGYVYDTNTGLYYLQSRYYDPVTGRFINADATVLTVSLVLNKSFSESWKSFCQGIGSGLTSLWKTICDGISSVRDWSIKRIQKANAVQRKYIEAVRSVEKVKKKLKKNKKVIMRLVLIKIINRL